MKSNNDKSPLLDLYQTGHANAVGVNQSGVPIAFAKLQAAYSADTDEDVARIIANSKIVYKPQK